MMACSTGASCVTSCSLAPVTTSDNGTPRPSTSRCRLLPFFSPISWVAPERLLRQGRFEHGPVEALPSPGDTLHLVVLCKTGLPDRLEHACRFPLQEALVDRTGAAESLLGKCLPWAARAQHVHNRLKDLACRLGWPPSSGLTQILLVCSPLAQRDQRLNARPEIVSHNPRVNPLACRHAFAPPPRDVRPRAILYYLRINS